MLCSENRCYRSNVLTYGVHICRYDSSPRIPPCTNICSSLARNKSRRNCIRDLPCNHRQTSSSPCRSSLKKDLILEYLEFNSLELILVVRTISKQFLFVLF